MPTYEYECTACGQHIEVFQRIAADPLSTCGVCGGPLRKVFHPAGIVFKGSGFYATDSRSSKPAAATSSEQKGGSSAESSTSSGSTSSDGKGPSKTSGGKGPAKTSEASTP